MVAADACAAASDEAVWRCCDVASFQAAFANSCVGQATELAVNAQAEEMFERGNARIHN